MSRSPIALRHDSESSFVRGPVSQRGRSVPAAQRWLVVCIAAAAGLGAVGAGPRWAIMRQSSPSAQRNMRVSGDWLVPRLFSTPFLRKPPLPYWLVAGRLVPLPARCTYGPAGHDGFFEAAFGPGRLWHDPADLEARLGHVQPARRHDRGAHRGHEHLHAALCPQCDRGNDPHSLLHVGVSAFLDGGPESPAWSRRGKQPPAPRTAHAWVLHRARVRDARQRSGAAGDGRVSIGGLVVHGDPAAQFCAQADPEP